MKIAVIRTVMLMHTYPDDLKQAGSASCAPVIALGAVSAECARMVPASCDRLNFTVKSPLLIQRRQQDNAEPVTLPCESCLDSVPCDSTPLSALSNWALQRNTVTIYNLIDDRGTKAL